MQFNTAGIDLSGRVAIVTGGGRGLGRGMAQALARAGAAVAVSARSEAELAETARLITDAGGRTIAIPTDVTDADPVARMVDLTERELGPVDILVNNAGVIGILGPIWEVDPAAWHQTMDINCYGSFLCARAVLKGMIERRRGWIINVASGAGLGAIRDGSSYCISKAAQIRLAECLADDAREYGISAFAIDPGTVRTAMTEYLMESEAGQKYTPWVRGFFAEGHDVAPELSANLVTLLASGRCDALSGRFISVSDDLDAMLRQAGQIQEDDLYTLRLRMLLEA